MFGRYLFLYYLSYLKYECVHKAHIAGPTATTHDNFKTFWKMVWHERSELIVMVTNLNEPSVYIVFICTCI